MLALMGVHQVVYGIRNLINFVKYSIILVENFKYLGVILNEDNNNETDLQEGINNANETYATIF